MRCHHRAGFGKRVKMRAAKVERVVEAETRVFPKLFVKSSPNDQRDGAEKLPGSQ